MKKKTITELLLIIAIVVINIIQANAQTPFNPFDWKLNDNWYSYDDFWGSCPGSSWAKSAALLSTGELVVAGQTTAGSYSPPHTHDACYNKLVISKYNSSGQEIANYVSTNIRDGSSRDVIQIVATSNDDIFILGTTEQNKNVIIKLNSALTEQWKFTIQQMSEIYIDADQAGNLIMAYIKPDMGAASGKVIVIKKYNALNGSLVFTRYLNDTKDASTGSLKCLKVDENDNIYLCGSVISPVKGSRYLTAKFNYNGNYEWSRFFDGEASVANDVANALVIDHNQNVIVTGYSFRNANQLEVATVKYNSNGWFQWVKRCDVIDDYYSNGSLIDVDGSDNIYVIANHGEAGLWSSNGLRSIFLKYDSNGNQIKKRNFATTKIYSLAVSQQGSCYLGGTNQCDYSTCPDFPFAGLASLTKINNAGTTDWNYYTQASSSQTGYLALFNSILINDATGEAWFSGAEHTNYQLTHNFSWMIAHITSAQRMTGNYESNNELSIYPNPATDRLQLVFNYDIEQAQLTILDLQGRVVMNKALTSNDETIDVTLLKPGLYVVRIDYDGNVFNKKFVKD